MLIQKLMQPLGSQFPGLMADADYWWRFQESAAPYEEVIGMDAGNRCNIADASTPETSTLSPVVRDPTARSVVMEAGDRIVCASMFVSALDWGGANAPFTLEYWIRFSGIANANGGIGDAWTFLNQHTFVHEFKNNGSAVIAQTAWGNHAVTLPAGTIVDGNWYMITVTNPGGPGAATVYLNGQSQGTSDTFSSYDADNAPFDTNYPPASGAVTAWLAELSIWRSVLDAATILSHYNAAVN